MAQSKLDESDAATSSVNGDDAGETVEAHPVEGPMLAELKSLDKKTNEYATTYYEETPPEKEIPDQVNWWSKFALCLVRHMTGGSPAFFTGRLSLVVNSPHLKDLLKKIVVSYPGMSFDIKDVTIESPFHVLFHHRHDFKAASKALDDGSEAAKHLEILLDFIDTEFKETIVESENLLEQGLLSYEHLWTIFKPGTLVFAPVFGQPRGFILKGYSYTDRPPGLALDLEYVDFDGHEMGTRSTGRLIEAFAGAEKINTLSAYPMTWHAAMDKTTKELVARGRRWEQCAGMHFYDYRGIALDYSGGYTPERYNVDGRLVVDTKTYHRLNSGLAFNVDAFKAKEHKSTTKSRSQVPNESNGWGDEYVDYDEYGYESEKVRHDLLDQKETKELVPSEKLKVEPLSDEQCMLANSVVRGFTFSEKRWCDFFVDSLKPVAWNSNCFEQLVLPNAQKDLVRALVATHVQQRIDFDDIVKGKGKGLILVLHGPPGVGKTLTAETVAEYSMRPLYSVSAGDLGTDSSELDRRLTRILDMASTWKAALLIDEADVFLERRSLHDLQRNSLVSIFLRVLEYYEGILFLTSNRVNTFDDAFKSRIHVPLKYNDLTEGSRKAIWKNFLVKMAGDVHLGEEDYDSLAKADINGRQIKNVVRTAKSLAQFHGQKLDREKLEQVIGIQMEFENELDVKEKSEGNC